MSDTNGVLAATSAGAREGTFPGVDHWEPPPRALLPAEIGTPDTSLSLDRPVPAGDQNPYSVYLATLSNDESKRAMAGCLDRTATLWTARAGLELPRPAGLRFPWHQLRYQHTAAVRALLLEQTTAAGRPWSPAYRNKHLTAVRMVLQHAWLLGHMSAEDYHRAAHIKEIKGVRLPPGRHVAPAELATLLRTCLADGTLAGVRDAALIATLYSTGCRREEIATADRAQYDPGRRALRIIGKGDKEREVYLTEEAAVYLGQWLAQSGIKHGPLFSPIDKWGQVRRRHMTPDAVGKVVSRRGEQAGVPPVSAHDLRRTFISDLLDAGVDLATVQQLAGHALSSTTALYDRRPAGTRQAAVNQLRVPRIEEVSGA